MYYLVTMYRWGDLEDHNYCAGCFTKKARAEVIGEWEQKFRGGKYEPVVTKVDKVPKGVKLNEVDKELEVFIEYGATGYWNYIKNKFSK